MAAGPDAGAHEVGSVALGRSLVGADEQDPFVLGCPPAAVGASAYRDLLQCAGSYQFGDFLLRPFDPEEPGYAPEMLFADLELRGLYERLDPLFRERYVGTLWDGLPYREALDQRHRVPAEDLQFLKDLGCFAVTVPQEFGGSEWSKAAYYLLTYCSARHADMAQALTIQVNNTLGTVPILSGLRGDLARARTEIAAFLTESAGWTLAGGEAAAHAKALRRSPALRLFTRELAALLEGGGSGFPWERPLPGGMSGSRLEGGAPRGTVNPGTSEASNAGVVAELARVRQAAREYAGELERRERTHTLLLRLIAAGFMPRFGLTEPGAGSDTARIATAGTLHRVRLQRDADGVPYFLLDGDPKARRNLVDATRLEAGGRVGHVGSGGRLLYRHADDQPRAVLHHEEYDYETDDPARARFYMHGQRRVEYHDVAQIRRDEAGEYYEYYELTGSKMWITNSRWQHFNCVYARIPEGLTAFVVDRHAEGYVVNRDEPKVGQRGSVTNPITLDRVRVPRENILGVEGRGQVNALETLNLGRTGLATLATTMMEDALDQARAALADRDEVSEATLERLGAAAAEAFAAESVVYAVVGLADHPGTRSVRLESAVSKGYATDVLQEVVTAAELAIGPESHVQPHDLERKKRDARIMTIYEGTNQVQRFAIIRELFEELLPRWSPADLAAAALKGARGETDRAKRELRQRLEEAWPLWGAEIYRNPNLQAVFFPLADVVVRIFALEATERRAAWVEKQTIPAWRDYRGRVAAAARLYRHRALAAIRERFAAYDRAAAELRAERYPAAVQAARLALLEWEARAPAPPRRGHAVTEPLTVAVLAAPVPQPPPHPTLDNGDPREPVWDFGPAERRALAEALALKAAAAAPVRLVLLAAAPPAGESRLRLTRAAGFDHVVRLDAPALPLPAMETAERLTAALVDLTETPQRDTPQRDTPQRDTPQRGVSTCPPLVLAGEVGAATGRGLVPALVAAALGRPLAAGARGWSVRHDAEGETEVAVETAGGEVSLREPLVISFSTGGAGTCEAGGREFTSGGFLRSVADRVPVLPNGAHAPVAGYLLPAAAQGSPGSAARVPAQRAAAACPEAAWKAALPGGSRQGTGAGIEEAASALRELLGLSSRPAGAYGGPVERVRDWPTGPKSEIRNPKSEVVYLAEPAIEEVTRASAEGARAAAAVARHLGEPLRVAVPVPAEADERRARPLVTPFLEAGASAVVAVVAPRLAGASPLGYAAALACLWPTGAPRLLIAGAWATEALGRFGRERGVDRLMGRVREIGLNGGLLIATAAYGGRLRYAEPVDLQNGPAFWTLADGARVGTWDFGCRMSDVGMAGPTGPNPQSAIRNPQSEEVFLLPLDPPYDAARDPLARRDGRTLERPWSDADCILDVGYALRNRDNLERLVLPLQEQLRRLGVQRVALGGTRKVTEELKLLPAERQIGQTGVAVNPPVLLALGVSGAPQHLDYIGERTTILAFNRDPEAPIMTLNRRKPLPKVFPVVGDLFETLPALMRALENGRG